MVVYYYLERYNGKVLKLHMQITLLTFLTAFNKRSTFKFQSQIKGTNCQSAGVIY